MPETKDNPQVRRGPRGKYSLGGCGICRRRHVRCDKTRPACHQCRSAGEVCDGFKTELKWIKKPGYAYKNDESAASQGLRKPLHYTEEAKASMTSALLSKVAAEDVDRSLLTLERNCKNMRKDLSKVEGAEIGPFGAFRVHQPAPQPPSRQRFTPASNSYSLNNEESRFDLVDIGEPDEMEPTPATGILLPDVGSILDWPDLFDMDSPFYFLSSSDLSGPSNLSATPRLPNLLSIEELGLGNLARTFPSPEVTLQSARASNEQPDNMPNNERPSVDDLSPEDAQMLLRHLKDRCMPHMWSSPLGRRCPLEIHLNAAITTLANITFMARADVSHASSANLLALLAISAKHLAAQSCKTHPEVTSRWDQFAEKMIDEARERLKFSLQHEVSPKVAKYKDQVMAVSMMLAFAILFDRQNEARCYMIDAERLLRTCGLAKRRISRKSRLLHHTYTWNRIVGESTYVLQRYGHQVMKDTHNQLARPTGDQTVSQANGNDSLVGPLFPQNPRLDDFLHLESLAWNHDNTTDRREAEILHGIHLEKFQGKSESTFMLLYGISETWLTLLSQTTRLANVMEMVNANGKSPEITLLNALEKRKQQLENNVCSFAVNHRTTDSELEATSARTNLVGALNSALVIFFYRRIRNINPWILREHVNNVIQALKDFDTSRELEGIDAPGSPWPAFMAGCEAMTAQQKAYLSDWMDKAYAKTGFSRLLAAKDCMHEVWRRRQRLGQESGEEIYQDWTWVQVSKEQHLYILLS